MSWNELYRQSKCEIADNFTKDTVVVVLNDHEDGVLEVYNDPNGYIKFDFDVDVIDDVEEMMAQQEFFKKLMKYLEE